MFQQVLSQLVFLLILGKIDAFLKYEKQTVVLLSFDGFRHDYIERDNLKNFKELAKHGVKAKSLESSFVTKTFPNHFTIVTGLYEESHGIVSNYMYDPLYNEYFDPSSTDPKWWNATTPIWILNEIQFLKNSKRTRKSATIFWPGSETSYNGHWPYYTRKNYEANVDAKERFKKIFDLLTEPNPANFIACYFQEPDGTSHHYGPESNETSEVLQQLDRMLGDFVKKLKKFQLFDKINLILVSDHGMTTVSPDHVIKLTDYVNPDDYSLVNYGTFLLIRPRKGKTSAIFNKMKNITHLKTYLRQNIPTRWHYKNNRRITKIFAIADEGYFVAPGNKNVTIPKGNHGYDNKLQSMHGIFIAAGPAFKKNYAIDTVKNIDLCVLMCHILDIKPHPNNGSLDRIKHIVVEKTLFTVIMKSPALIVTLISVCGIFILVAVIGCTISCIRNLLDSSKYRPVDDSDVPLTAWHDDEDKEYELFRRD